MKPCVYIGMPARDAVEGQTADDLMRLYDQLPRFGIEPMYRREYISGLVLARNLLAGSFRAEPRATHLLMVDSDVAGFRAEDVARMIESGLDVIGAPVPSRVLSPHWLAMIARAREEGVADEDLHRYRSQPLLRLMPGGWDIKGHAIEVEAIGTGFLLLTRAALERVISQLDSYASEQGTAPPLAYLTGPDGARREVVSVFDFSVDERLEWVGEDFGFCFRYRQMGGRVWADTLATLVHVGREMWTAPPLEESLGIAKARLRHLRSKDGSSPVLGSLSSGPGKLIPFEPPPERSRSEPPTPRDGSAAASPPPRDERES